MPTGFIANPPQNSDDEGLAEDLVGTAIAVVVQHPAVNAVELAGSRERGTHQELSEWDFAVTTSDFAAVARDMSRLVKPLNPLGEPWEPMGHFPVYQVLMPGPTKVEYLFLDQSQAAAPAGDARPIDTRRHRHSLLGLDLVDCDQGQRRP